MPNPPTPPPYAEWGRITRFLESARLAFARERNLWSSLEIVDGQKIELAAPAGQGTYRVNLDRHIATIQDEGILLSSVLVHSYALAESSALERLSLPLEGHGDIESWGSQLLAMTGQSWDKVTGRIGGAVEVAVIRNAIAHGTRMVDVRAVNRLAAVGVTTYAAGDEPTMTYEAVKQYRSRLLSLMRLGAVGS